MYCAYKALLKYRMVNIIGLHILLMDKYYNKTQAESNITVDISFQVNNIMLAQDFGLNYYYGYVYKIERMDVQSGNTVLSNVTGGWKGLGTFTWGLGSSGGPNIQSSYRDNLSLAKGWYRVSLALAYIPLAGDATIYQTMTTSYFGVGDIYFVAGQSNSSGYDYSEFDNNTNFKTDGSINRHGVRFIKNNSYQVKNYTGSNDSNEDESISAYLITMIQEPHHLEKIIGVIVMKS